MAENDYEIEDDGAQESIPCKEAKDALIMAIVGLFCFGIILGPIAIVKANKAKKLMAENPNLTGEGKATAALVIGIIDVVLFVLGIGLQVAAAGAAAG